MSLPQMVIITGAPATGKTTLGKRVAESLELPLLSKDGIKETLFDTLGWKDRDQSRKLGHASTALLYFFANAMLEVCQSLIVESNFDAPYATAAFSELMGKHPFAPLQILCHSDANTLAERYKKRADSGERHPGHVDHVLYRELDVMALRQKHGRLALGGPIIQVDTTDLDAIDYASICDSVAALTTSILRDE